jgi:hypothetical protein
MKIRPIGNELFDTDRRTNITNLTLVLQKCSLKASKGETHEFLHNFKTTEYISVTLKLRYLVHNVRSVKSELIDQLYQRQQTHSSTYYIFYY